MSQGRTLDQVVVTAEAVTDPGHGARQPCDALIPVIKSRLPSVSSTEVVPADVAIGYRQARRRTWHYVGCPEGLFREYAAPNRTQARWLEVGSNAHGY